MNTKYKTPILLIEDNAEDAGLIKDYLEDVGFKYELYHTETLYEGINLIHKTPIEIVLLDLNLPDSSGFKTVTTYLEKAADVPAIIITSMNNEIIGNQAIKAGAQDFLIKGQFDSKIFGRSVRYSLQRAKVQLKLEETARELEQSKKRFLQAQKMAHFGTWEMDIVSSEMTWSDEVYRIFSFMPGSLSPTLSEYLTFIPLEERPAVESFFENAAKDGQLHKAEHRILVDGTNIRYVTIQGKVQVDDSGKIILAGSIQDITERKMSEKLLIEKNISSQTAKIQEAVLGDLSFQIRTPLSSIVNLLFLLENTENDSQQTAYIGDLKTSVSDLSLSVNNLLNFSVMVADNVKVEDEEFNISDFLTGAQNIVKIKADSAKLPLVFNIDQQLPEKITGDPKKITQILYNLIEHAIFYTGNDAEIFVSAKGSKVQGNNFNLNLSVKNTGTVISRKEINQLLQAEKLLEIDLEEKDSESQKRKLGIAIVSKLTQTLGGTLNIQSKQGEGTEFIISLPVKIPRQTRLLNGDAPDVPLKILLVEDHFLNQIATKKVLTSWSEMVTVDIAENGLIAVEKFKEYGYDLVLMDIQMPVMNGLDAANKIREFSNVPIIALTANSTKQEQDKCFEIGMNDYLAKPFKPQELYARIMNIMSLVLN